MKQIHVHVVYNFAGGLSDVTSSPQIGAFYFDVQSEFLVTQNSQLCVKIRQRFIYFFEQSIALIHQAVIN